MTRRAGAAAKRAPARRPKRVAAPRRIVRSAAVRLVLVTVPDEACGRAIARALVEARLAACGNVLPIAASLYRWEGNVVEEPECLLLLKTRASQIARMAARVLALHPYTLPEILVIDVEAGLDAYLNWVREEAGG